MSWGESGCGNHLRDKGCIGFLVFSMFLTSLILAKINVCILELINEASL